MTRLVPLVALVLTATIAHADKAADRKKLLPQLIGATVGSFGPALASVSVDDDEPDDRARAKLEPLGFRFMVGSHGFVIVMPDQRTCDAFAAVLTARWGKPRVDGGFFWLNPKTGVRSRMFGCEWTTDRYLTVETFVNRSTSSRFPLFLLGQPETAINAEIKRLGDGRWESPAIDTSIGKIELFADSEHGKVIRVIARLPDVSVLPALRRQLEKLFGTPSEGKAEPRLTWSGPATITVDGSNNELLLIAGAAWTGH